MKSLFFEDTELKHDEGVELQEEEVLFVEDVTGLISATLESESNFHNIYTTTLTEQAQALHLEDEAAIQSSKKQYFEKIIKFFQELWKKFSSLIQNLVNRLTLTYTNGDKFLKSIKGKINTATLSSKEMEVYNWKFKTMAKISAGFPRAIGAVLAKYVNESASTGTSYTADQLAQKLGYASLSEIDTKIVGMARDSKKKKVKLDTTIVGFAEGDVATAKNMVSVIKDLSSSSKKVIEDGLKYAKEGISASKEDGNKKAAATSTAKSATSVINKILNVYVKLQSEKFSESLAILKKAAGSSSAPKDDAVKKEDEEILEDINFDEEETETLIEGEQEEEVAETEEKSDEVKKEDEEYVIDYDQLLFDEDDK
ncbi:hypothetical protein Bp8pS_272 [Bacillus phage vB_BpuM-BpSp]|nr:hypothetical protein Bp8pS_272 [Bacillus phage vB_BpuM-BpSp]